MQCQITTNISCLLFVFAGTIWLGSSPLNTVMLLWVNMIMDTLAALALATERPSPTIIRQAPLKPGEYILNSVMWRQIYGVTLYQIFALFIGVWFGQSMWDNATYSKDDPSDEESKKYICMLFNIYVFMQLFNYLNCRIPNPKSINIFQNFFSNPLFFIVWLGAILLQIIFCQWGGYAF